MRIRIVGDGTYRGTRVVDERGETLEMVTSLELKLDRKTGLAQARLTFEKVPIEIVAELEEAREG